jgi:hypothetical protein
LQGYGGKAFLLMVGGYNRRWYVHLGKISPLLYREIGK